jgi:hypothetical protein
MVGPKLIFLSLWVTTSALLHGQVYGGDQETLFWWKNHLVRDKGDTLVVEGLSKKDRKTIEKEAYFSGPYDVFEDRFWTTKKVEGESNEVRLVLYSSADARHWSQEGYLPVSRDERPISIWPLQRDKFLAAYSWHIERGRQSSPFAILKRGEGNRFEIDSLPNPGFPGRLRHKEKDSGNWVFAAENAMLSLTWGRRFVRTPSALVLCNTMTGYFWVVNTDREAPEVELVKLYPKLSGIYLGEKSDTIQPPLLTVQPMRDGKVIITSRSEEATFRSREVEQGFQFRTPPDLKTPQYPKGDEGAKEQAYSHGLTAFPDLMWWNLDPSSLTLKKMDTPNGFAPHFQNLKQLREFTFTLEPDGNVRVPKG